METLKGWKTVLTNGLLVIAGVLAQLGVVLPETFADDVTGIVVASVGVINIVLRAFTNSPIGKSQ